ncbi:MAG: hypothetical protein Q9212_004728 [Teloschistes hypoglaucus]
MSSAQMLRTTEETEPRKEKTLHVTFKEADPKPKHCAAEDVKQIKDGADRQVIVDDTLEEDYVMIGSISKKQKDRREETIAEAREFLARTEARMAKKFKQASKRSRTRTETFTNRFERCKSKQAWVASRTRCDMKPEGDIHLIHRPGLKSCDDCA